MAPLIWPTATTRGEPLEPLAVAFGLGQPAGHLEAEGDRFAVDGVGTADHHRVPVGPGQLAQGAGEGVELRAQQPPPRP